MPHQHLMSISYDLKDNKGTNLFHYFFDNLKRDSKIHFTEEKPETKKLSHSSCPQGTESTKGTYANSLSPELTTTNPHYTDANQALTLLPKRKSKHVHGIRK